MSNIRTAKKLNYKILGSDDSHYFVGYYDKDPISFEGKHLLCHRVQPIFENMVEPKCAEIGLLCIKTNNFQKLVETNAMNWQLGSRAQWLDKDMIIFNDIIDGIQCSVKFNIHKEERVKVFKRPFWDISKNKKYAASLNFSRIKTMRPGYGYRGSNIDTNQEVLNVFDLEDDRLIFSITLNEILEKINFVNTNNHDIYLNHIVWSPCNEKLMTIFHYEDVNYKERKIFPVLIHLRSKKIDFLHSDGYFSHHTFIDEDRILAYLRLNDQLCFAIWSEKTGWIQIDSMPKLDGHPTYIKSTNKIVVDSYPNRFGFMSLYLGSLSKHEGLKKLLKVLSPPNYKGPLRCDLHPRVSSDHGLVICDFPYKSGRKILLLEGVLSAK